MKEVYILSRPDFRNFFGVTIISHSAKGSEWEKHKYVKKIDGKYFYPDSYEGGRHVGTEKSKALFEKAKKFALGSRSNRNSESSSSSNGKPSSKISSSEKREEKKYVPKEAVDPKDRKAVLKRVNESLGRISKSNVKASKGKTSKASKGEDSEETQNIAEQYVEKLEDAKINLEMLRDAYKDSDKDEKAQLKREISEVQAELKKIRSQIKVKTKNNKALRKIINELTSDN